MEPRRNMEFGPLTCSLTFPKDGPRDARNSNERNMYGCG